MLRPGSTSTNVGETVKETETIWMDESEQEQRRLAIADLMPTTPFISWVGMRSTATSPMSVVLRVPFRPELTNDGTYYHGGVVASAIDTAGAAGAWSNHDFKKGARASTVSMSLQYVGACKKSDLCAMPGRSSGARS